MSAALYGFVDSKRGSGVLGLCGPFSAPDDLDLVGFNLTPNREGRASAVVELLSVWKMLFEAASSWLTPGWLSAPLVVLKGRIERKTTCYIKCRFQILRICGGTQIRRMRKIIFRFI